MNLPTRLTRQRLERYLGRGLQPNPIRRYKSRATLTRALRLIAKADLELRSSPANKLLVLERLILALATEPTTPTYPPTHQFAMEL